MRFGVARAFSMRLVRLHQLGRLDSDVSAQGQGDWALDVAAVVSNQPPAVAREEPSAERML
jgi:hypothetical protein